MKVRNLLLVVLGVIAAVVLVPLAVVWITGGIFHTGGQEKEFAKTISVYITKEDRVAEMDTEEYLKCVVGAEMPVEFEEEALKAQSVAARTYLLSHMQAVEKNGPPEEHKGASVCTDFAHCQAWMSETDRKAAWEAGKGEAYWKKISKAVESTAGEVMTYEGQPISAVFFSTSSGKTEAAKDVWGGEVPYLQSVESPGEESSPRFHSQVDFSIEEFKAKAEEKLQNLSWDGELFCNIVRSNAGGILSIDIGGVTVKGTEFRTMFGLRSTNVVLTQDESKVHMEVAGNGHGVGMSQYGANAMAAGGSKYRDILTHYYTGVTVEKWGEK